MKLKQIILCLLFLSVGVLQAQNKKHEQIKSLKVSFFTTALELTPEEASKFWPIYNTFDEKAYKIRHDRVRPLIKKMDETGIDKMSAKEAEAYLNKFEAADKDLLSLKQQLTEDLIPIIGPVKVLKLKKAEEDFKAKLLEQFRDKKKD